MVLQSKIITISIKHRVVYFFSLVTVSFLLTSYPLQAANQSLEYKIKAGYIFNFTKFILWPADIETNASIPFSICLLGSNPFNNLLNPIETKIIKSRTIHVVQLDTLALEKYACRILFISKSEAHRIPDILLSIPTTDLLTVSDVDDFITLGGMIEFIIDKNRVVLRIHQQRLNRAGLTINPRLLSVAKIVNDDE